MTKFKMDVNDNKTLNDDDVCGSEIDEEIEEAVEELPESPQDSMEHPMITLNEGELLQMEETDEAASNKAADSDLVLLGAESSQEYEEHSPSSETQNLSANSQENNEEKTDEEDINKNHNNLITVELLNGAEAVTAPDNQSSASLIVEGKKDVASDCESSRSLVRCVPLTTPSNFWKMGSQEYTVIE